MINIIYQTKTNLMTSLDEQFKSLKVGREGGFTPIILQGILNTFKIPYLKFFRNFIPDPTNYSKTNVKILAWIYPIIENVSEQINIGSYIFNLEFGVIHFRIKKDQPPRKVLKMMDITITEYVDLYAMGYNDSSTNYIHTFDWRNINNSDAFIKKASELWSHEVSNVFLVYTNSEKYASFTPDNSENYRFP